MPQPRASTSGPRTLFRAEALRSHVLERRGVASVRLALSHTRTSVLWLIVGALLAGLVALGFMPVPLVISGPAFLTPGSGATAPSLVALLPPAAALHLRPGDALTWRPPAADSRQVGRVTTIHGTNLEGGMLAEVLERRGLAISAVKEPVAVVEAVLADGPTALLAQGASPAHCPMPAGTVEVEVGSRPLFSLLPGLDAVPREAT